jgi:hypothetical protein
LIPKALAEITASDTTSLPPTFGADMLQMATNILGSFSAPALIIMGSLLALTLLGILINAFHHK